MLHRLIVDPVKAIDFVQNQLSLALFEHLQLSHSIDGACSTVDSGCLQLHPRQTLTAAPVVPPAVKAGR